MSHQSVPARLNAKKAPGPSPSPPSGPPVQSSSGICIKQEYFEDQFPMTRTIKTESSESPPNEHNIMQSIKVEVKEEEHYDYQDCVVKRELDEGEQIDRKIKVEDVSSGQSVQRFKCVKKEDEDDGEYLMDCDCEECETCRVKREMKEELDQSDETELGGNSFETVQGGTIVKQEEVERPNKIRRMDRVVENVQVGSQSSSSNVISINFAGLDDQVATSSTTPTTIQDQTRPSKPAQLLNGEPRIDNVGLVVEVRAEEFDREQIDGDNSTLNPVHIDRDDEEAEVEHNQNDDEQDDEEEGDQTIDQRQDTNDGDGQQVPAENFVKRIEPTDELGNKFECDYRGCGKRTKGRSDLIKHIRTHTGEKPFKCSVEGCDRAFVQNAQLDQHLYTHSGSRPFVCTWPGCEARFASKGNLTAHLRTHTGERPFKCDQCDAAFTHHSNLASHLRTHTGARPFVCTWPECGQAFTCLSSLKTHSTVHSNERKFVCDVTGCTKVYKRKDALRRHQKAKHN